ncbi:hypothetical protein WDZ17_14005 [Pseudokineococcus basanitobsidens]|uniref:LPXTG-motif cell wall-anchored protein n=1 Tax=Pseudokineococcus basanitobsidens TaxID=1926649 RepID=A0ABU8RMT2_9ACTN
MTPVVRPAAPRAARARTSRAAALVLLVPGLGASLLGASLLGAPAATADGGSRAPSVPGAATTAPGGTAEVDAAAAAADGVTWELVGVPDPSLVRSASVDAATGAVAVDVAPGYRGRVVLQRRAVDRSRGVAGEPAPVVVEVGADEDLEPGERLRLPLDGSGEASVEVPLPAPPDGGSYAVEAGPGLDAEVDGGDVLRVTADHGAAGARSVVLVPTAEDGTQGEPVEVRVDVAPSLAPASGGGRADEDLGVRLPEVVGDADVLDVQSPGAAAASVDAGVLHLDPRGSSGLLALAVVPRADGVVGDPAPVTVEVVPVVAPVDVDATAGEQVRVPLETTGSDVRVELADDADGALALDGDELVVSVPDGVDGPLEGAVVATDADGLRSGSSPVAVTVLSPGLPPGPPPGEPDADPAPDDDPAASPPQEPAAPPGSDRSPSDRSPVRLRAAVLPSSSADDGSTSGTSSAGTPASGRTSSPSPSATTSPWTTPVATVSPGATGGPAAAPTATTAAPSATPAAPGLVVLETFSTASPTPAPTAGTTPTSPATATGTAVTALPRTGGELVVGGLLGLLVLAAGAALLAVSRRLARLTRTA